MSPTGRPPLRARQRARRASPLTGGVDSRSRSPTTGRIWPSSRSTPDSSIDETVERSHGAPLYTVGFLGLRARVRLPRRRRSAPAGATPQRAPHARACGQRRRRRPVQRHLSPRRAWRLAADRADGVRAVRPGARQPGGVRSRRPRAVRAPNERDRDLSPGVLTTVQDLGRPGWRTSACRPRAPSIPVRSNAATGWSATTVPPPRSRRH